ncbi:RNA polymerase sigma factor [Enhygromyxa salina]|nr:RNA polymerase sigma factor [Enhygromyxa salina]
MKLDELIHAARAGDPRAYKELGRWLNRELRAFFSNNFSDTEIDDLVQQTCEDTLKKLDTFESSDANEFRKWVLKAASFEAKTKTRERHREWARRRALHARAVTPKLSPTSSLYEREWREAFARCLAQLPEHERQAVQHWLDGGDDAELAERAGISVKTVWTRRHRGRNRLGELLKLALRTPILQSSPSSPSSSPRN